MNREENWRQLATKQVVYEDSPKAKQASQNTKALYQEDTKSKSASKQAR